MSEFEEDILDEDEIDEYYELGYVETSCIVVDLDDKSENVLCLISPEVRDDLERGDVFEEGVKIIFLAKNLTTDIDNIDIGKVVYGSLEEGRLFYRREY